MFTEGQRIRIDTREERLALGELAWSTILRLEGKRKPLTPEEQQKLQFCRRLSECCNQLPI